jgi:two-component system alkaline phosphatase synthesis response regulator PhoP
MGSDMENKLKILIVDDDLDFIEFISHVLTNEGFLVFQAGSGEAAIELAQINKPHLILLDIMMPGMNGIETCISIRNIPEISQTKIVFVSALSDDNSKIQSFEAGGDDYVCKPVKPKVLVARLGALLRKSYEVQLAHAERETYKKIGNITIDFEKYIVLVDEKEISLPKKEFLLLKLLVSKPSKVFTRQEIFALLWGDGIYGGSRYIDVHIHNLRDKLGSNHIKTVKGVGYKFL